MEKMQKQVTLTQIFFSKKNISKEMNAINYTIKKLGWYIPPKTAHENCNYPEYVLCLQKNVKIDKNQKFVYFFFVKNPCGSQ